MGLEYPDVLVSTLSSVLSQFSEQIRENEPSSEPSWFASLFRRQRTSELERVANELDLAAESLEELKLAPSESEIEWTSSYASEESVSRRRTGAVGGRSKILEGGMGSDSAQKASRRSGGWRIGAIQSDKGRPSGKSYS